MRNPSSSFPINYRTLVFCFLMGSVLSFPCGLIWNATARPFIPPSWTIPYYFATVAGSLLLLPFWSGFALRGIPLLQRIGIRTFVVMLVFVVFGLLFPAL